MRADSTVGRRAAPFRLAWAAICCAGLLVAGTGRAQTDTAPPSLAPPKVLTLPAQPAAAPAQPMPATPMPAAASGIEQASCRSCGSGGLIGGFGGCSSGGCGANCYPGRFCDHECGTHQDTHIGRMWQHLYECLCCPDPCYQPRWVAAANAAFFADQVRPVTQMRLRWDAWRNGQFRDRAEYLLARGDGNGKYKPPPGNRIQSARFDMDQFYMYNEGATERFGAFIELAYRNVDPQRPGDESDAGFSDMRVGTKSLLLDCELLQITFQFQTFIPTGLAGKGLGTGHVSLEPSLLWALKLAPSTYFQAQTAYSIPISGDDTFAGDVFHYHLSLNQVLWRPLTGVQIIGTAELNGWSILNGAFTVPGAGFEGARGVLVSAGPGLRVVICDKIDFGLGTAFAVTADKWAEQMYRAEFRWRF